MKLTKTLKTRLRRKANLNIRKFKKLYLVIPTLLVFILFISPCFSISEKNIVNNYLYGNDKELLLISQQKTATELTPLNSFLLGKYLYKSGLYERSILFLKKSIITDENLFQDHAIYWLGKALEKIGNQTNALKLFGLLRTKHPHSIYAQKALKESSKLAYELKKDERALKLLKKELSICKRWEKSRIFSRIAEIQSILGMKKLATNSLYQLISLKRHNRQDRKATRLLLATPYRYHPNSEAKRIIYYEALIRNKKDNLALTRLRNLRRTTVSKKYKFEIELNIIWLLRRKRLWNSALHHLNRLKLQPTTVNQKLKIYRHYFKIQLARNDIKSAEKTIRKMSRIQSKNTFYYYKQISKKYQNYNTLSFNYNLRFARKFPHSYYFRNKLIRFLIKDYSSRKYTQLLRRAKIVRKLIKNKNQKASLCYYMSESATKLNWPIKKINALRVQTIKAQPLGFYHSQLIKKKRIPNITISTNGLEKKKVQDLAVLYFLANNNDKKKIRDLMKSLWDKSYIKKNLDQRFNFSKHSLFIPNELNNKFIYFWDNGLYKEAYLEFNYYRRKKKKKLNSYKPNQILFIARLAKKANLIGTSIYYYNKFIHLSGWGKELSIIEKEFQKTPIEFIYPQDYNTLVDKHAKKYNLNKLFIFSLIKQESGFTHDIKSWAGAVGLMQIMPATGRGIARQLGMKHHNLKNADDNIRIGSSFLSWLQKKFGSESEMLIGYNAGPNRVRQWKKRFLRKYRQFDRDAFIEFIPYLETRNYIKRVFSNMAVYGYLFSTNKNL